MQAAAPDAPHRAKRVRLMLFDVDGVLTDGRIWYGPQGEALKAFSVADGQGLKLLAGAGVSVGVLSSRASPATQQRCAELGLAHVMLGVEDKLGAFRALAARLGLAADEAGFMGDDLVDLPVLRACGFACAPRESAELVRSQAHYVAAAPAGNGAAREVCEYLLQAQGRLQAALQRFLA